MPHRPLTLGCGKVRGRVSVLKVVPAVMGMVVVVIGGVNESRKIGVLVQCCSVHAGKKKIQVSMELCDSCEEECVCTSPPVLVRVSAIWQRRV